MTVLEMNLATIRLKQPELAENLQRSHTGTAYKGVVPAKTGEPVPLFISDKRCNLFTILYERQNAPLPLEPVLCFFAAWGTASTSKSF